MIGYFSIGYLNIVLGIALNILHKWPIKIWDPYIALNPILKTSKRILRHFYDSWHIGLSKSDM
jgi:hypothetical protein